MGMKVFSLHTHGGGVFFLFCLCQLLGVFCRQLKKVFFNEELRNF